MNGKKPTIANRARHRPKGKLSMKNFLIKILCSRLGWLVKLVASGIVSLVTLGLTKLGVEVTPEMQMEIATLAGSATFIAIQSVILKLQLRSSEAIQQELARVFPGVAFDRYNGEKDLKKVKALATVVLRNADGSPIERAIPLDEKL